MRRRLYAAVRALLEDPGMAGLPDTARTAAVVLLAKARLGNGCRTGIWAAELGRWLGVSESTVDHTVLPALRRTGAVRSRVVTNDLGRATGLECVVMPLWHAHQGADKAHPLALTRAELATLLRLIEALFGPGWAQTAPGLLADRTGRGAATDRLGLLLLVLSSRSTGWLRLCGGTVDTRRGRPAATVARLLGCSPTAGARTLARLQEQGVVELVRRDTASGLLAGTRVRVLPVAQARAAFSDRARTALGDLVEAAALRPAVSAVESVDQAEDVEHAPSAPLHASHAVVSEVRGDEEVGGGFSGAAAVDGSRRRPERADTREGSPLRGEHQDTLIPRQQTRPTPVPPEDLRQVVEPVWALWQRLDRSGARARVVDGIRQALADAAAWTGPDPQAAAEVVADRLTRRLLEQGGPAAVTDPVGWILSRGLPRRPGCGEPDCDESTSLIVDGPCPTCALNAAHRRNLKAQLAADIDRHQAGATDEERQAAIDDGMRAEVEAVQLRHHWAAQERAARDAVLDRRRAEQAAAEQARAAAPCADCGRPESAGLCTSCGHRRATADAVQAAVDAALAGTADLEDPASVDAVTHQVKRDLAAELHRESEQAAAQGATPETLELLTKLTAENLADQYQRSALAKLGNSPEADTEAILAHDAAMRSAHRHTDRTAALAAATEASHRARWNTAEHLLTTRLAAIKASRTPAPAANPTQDTYTTGAARARAALRTTRGAA